MLNGPVGLLWLHSQYPSDRLILLECCCLTLCEGVGPVFGISVGGGAPLNKIPQGPPRLHNCLAFPARGVGNLRKVPPTVG